jgi:hypothetical protein
MNSSGTPSNTTGQTIDVDGGYAALVEARREDGLNSPASGIRSSGPCQQRRVAW